MSHSAVIGRAGGSKAEDVQAEVLLALADGIIAAQVAGTGDSTALPFIR